MAPFELVQIIVALLLCGVAAFGQTSLPVGTFDSNKARGVITEVTALDDRTQRYWVYLPTGYTAERSWPILYAFDPFARGKTAVEVYRSVAERYGYIIAGSNNSRNGQADGDMAGARAMWLDTHRRFALDKDHIYTTGLSGGARLATAVALYCSNCGVAGVIAQGAGYPQMKEPAPANEHFLYYATVGDEDFNYPEIMALRRKKEEASVPCKVKIFPGLHGWAPPEVAGDALEWLELKAMQMGTKKVDPVFLGEMWEKAKSEAADDERRGDALAEYYALRSLADDFKGMEDTSMFLQKLADLRGSKALKNAEHAEQQDFEKQNNLTANVLDELAHVDTTDSDAQVNLRQQIVVAMLDLRRHANSDSRDHTVYMRAYWQVLIAGEETGQDALRANRLAQAKIYFELMGQGATDQPGPMLLLAEVNTRAGNKKAALKAIEQAVQRGLKHAESLTQDPELQPLASDPEFQRVVKGLSAE